MVLNAGFRDFFRADTSIRNREIWVTTETCCASLDRNSVLMEESVHKEMGMLEDKQSCTSCRNSILHTTMDRRDDRIVSGTDSYRGGLFTCDLAFYFVLYINLTRFRSLGMRLFKGGDVATLDQFLHYALDRATLAM